MSRRAARSEGYYRTRYLMSKLGVKAGSLVDHLSEKHLNWIVVNKPPEMEIGESLVVALLDEAIAENTQ